jgi:hypothetical protein
MSAEKRISVTRTWTERQLSDNLNRVLSPAVCQQLVAALRRDHVDFTDVAGILQRDPFVTAKVVGMANLVKAPSQPTITSLVRAVQLLGLRKVRVLVMSVMLAGPLLEPDVKVTRRRDLWRWVIACGVAGDWIGKAVFGPDHMDDDADVADDSAGHAAEHLVSGLVMGLGPLVLYAGLDRRYARVMGLPIRPLDLDVREQQALGVTHHQVTTWALQSLRCPGEVGAYAKVLAEGQDNASARVGRAIEYLGARIAGFESDRAMVRLIDVLGDLGVDPSRLYGQTMTRLRQRARDLAVVFGMADETLTLDDDERRHVLRDAGKELEASLARPGDSRGAA